MAKNTPPGPGVDSSGQSVVDPSTNVRELVQAEVRRLDDLRSLEAGHIREITALRSEYDDKLRSAEASRIDAIRAVDVGAAAILANQVSASAEALRGQVEAARQQTANGLAAALSPIQNDIADLRRVQYEQQGKTSATTADRTERRLSSGQLVATLTLIVFAISIVISVALVAYHK